MTFRNAIAFPWSMALVVISILALALGGCGFAPISGRGFNQGMAHHLGPVHERLDTQDRKIDELQSQVAITTINVETLHGDLATMSAHVERTRDLAISTSAKVGAIQTQLLPSIYSTAKVAVAKAEAARAEANAAKKAVGATEAALGKKVDDSTTATQKVVVDAEGRVIKQVTDSEGRTATAVAGAEGRVTTAVVNSEGRMTKVIDPDIKDIRRDLEALAREHTAKHP